MDNALRTISYIADIGSVVVLMARRRMSHSASLDCTDTTGAAADSRKQYRMLCFVFESEDVSIRKGEGLRANRVTTGRRDEIRVVYRVNRKQYRMLCFVFESEDMSIRKGKGLTALPQAEKIN